MNKQLLMGVALLLIVMSVGALGIDIWFGSGVRNVPLSDVNAQVGKANISNSYWVSSNTISTDSTKATPIAVANLNGSIQFSYYTTAGSCNWYAVVGSQSGSRIIFSDLDNNTTHINQDQNIYVVAQPTVANETHCGVNIVDLNVMA